MDGKASGLHYWINLLSTPMKGLIIHLHILSLGNKILILVREKKQMLKLYMNYLSFT